MEGEGNAFVAVCVGVLFLILRRRRLRRAAGTEKRKVKRTKWVREIFAQAEREKYGQYHTLLKQLRDGDREYYFRYLRMSPERFEHLHSLVGPLIAKKDTKLRKAISSEERLVITLRYLATGDSQQSQSFNFRIGKSTVSRIVRETCAAIWEALHESYLKTPSTQEEWKSVANDFEEMWNFPHCIGAGDGKHVVIECPSNSGSEFYNYKGTYSIVLLAYGDAKYCFTAVDIGQYGKCNDSGTYDDSVIGKNLENNRCDIPPPEPLQGFQGNAPFVTVVDEGLPLRSFQMRPHPRRGLTEEQAIFNYRLSRARRIIENIFGILAARWRIYRRPIKADVSTVEGIVKATVCLHNYLQLTANAAYSPAGFVDSEDVTGNIRPGDWRKIVNNDSSALKSIPSRQGRTSSDGGRIRQLYTAYFNSPSGSVPWQRGRVRACGPQLC